MLDLRPHRVAVSASLFVAAATWPSALCLWADATTTLLQRALSTALCGTGPQSFELLGHCVACWSGAGALAFAGALVLTARVRPTGARS